MAHVYFGTDRIPRHWQRYFDQHTALELDLSRLEAPPNTSTLNRWRVESPRGFAFVLHADPAVVEGLEAAGDAGRTTIDQGIAEGWERTMERAKALAAKAVLVRLSPSFSPGQSNRELLTHFAQELAGPAKPAVILETQGLWTVPEGRGFAESVGLVYAFDPFIAEREEIAFTHGDACFVLTERAGMRRKFDQYDMERLLDWADNYQRVFVLLRGRFKEEHAAELRLTLEYAD